MGHHESDWRKGLTKTDAAKGLSESQWGISLPHRSPVKYILDLVLVADAQTYGYSPESATASRTTLPKGIDKPSDLLVVFLSGHSSTGGCVRIAECIAGVRPTPRLLLDIKVVRLALRVDDTPIGHIRRCPSQHLQG